MNYEREREGKRNGKLFMFPNKDEQHIGFEIATKGPSKSVTKGWLYHLMFPEERAANNSKTKACQPLILALLYYREPVDEIVEAEIKPSPFCCIAFQDLQRLKEKLIGLANDEFGIKLSRENWFDLSWKRRDGKETNIRSDFWNVPLHEFEDMVTVTTIGEKRTDLVGDKIIKRYEYIDKLAVRTGISGLKL